MTTTLGEATSRIKGGPNPRSDKGAGEPHSYPILQGPQLPLRPRGIEFIQSDALAGRVFDPFQNPWLGEEALPATGRKSPPLDATKRAELLGNKRGEAEECTRISLHY